MSDQQPKPAEAKPQQEKPEKKQREKKPKQPKQPKPAKAEAPKEAAGAKGATLLGVSTKKAEDLADWYSQVITRSEMIDYYDISGMFRLSHLGPCNSRYRVLYS